MCMYCNKEYFEDALESEITLGKEFYELGVLGSLDHSIRIRCDDQWELTSELYPNDADINDDNLQVIAIPIKYCPFCGRELS